jgi:hypothetical protein
VVAVSLGFFIGGFMKIKTQGWGDSMIATKYVYERIYDILDGEEVDMAAELSSFLDELAHNYKIDTGNLIAEDL